MNTVLEVKNLTMSFGGLCALNSVSLDVKKGEIAALIGPNGAGKTTFFNCLTGIYQASAGDIFIHPPQGHGDEPQNKQECIIPSAARDCSA